MLLFNINLICTVGAALPVGDGTEQIQRRVEHRVPALDHYRNHGGKRALLLVHGSLHQNCMAAEPRLGLKKKGWTGLAGPTLSTPLV